MIIWRPEWGEFPFPCWLLTEKITVPVTFSDLQELSFLEIDESEIDPNSEDRVTEEEQDA